MRIKAIFIMFMTVVARWMVPDLYFNDIMKKTSIFRRQIISDGYNRFFEQRRPLAPNRYRNHVRAIDELRIR